MTSFKTEIAEEIRQIPWKEYLKSQIIKVLGFIVVAILIVGVMIVCQDIDLETASYADTRYLIAITLSSIAFILVLIGFSKIILFDMSSEFGLKDEATDEIVYDVRFFLFATLALSFCSAIYLLLDVFLQDAYLELLPVLLMELVFEQSNAYIPYLSDISGREFYQTARNIYFGFFFLIIIIFSVLVFLSILTTLARKRVASRFQREEEIDEEEENKRVYKVLAWLGAPFFGIFLSSFLSTPLSTLATIILLIIAVWWVYQLLKTFFMILWRGMKITAFITSVNLLLILPLILVLYLTPVILWAIWDVFVNPATAVGMTFESLPLLWESFLTNAFDFLRILQLDFVIITMIATFVVGFAEGFAIIAIFSAIGRGVEVARTGEVLTRSPPKVIVLSKYLIMLSVWLGLSWNSLLGIWNMLVERLRVTLPPINIPSIFYLIYSRIIIPLSEMLVEISPLLQHVPLLIIPLYFIVSGAFKFLSVTLITPRVKERLSVFFLLISTAFVLIVTNILGDIYLIQRAPDYEGVQDAPLMGLENILTSAVEVFQYVEAIAFYAGFIFGIGWVIRAIIRARKSSTVTFKPDKKPIIQAQDLSLSPPKLISDEPQEEKESEDLSTEIIFEPKDSSFE